MSSDTTPQDTWVQHIEVAIAAIKANGGSAAWDKSDATAVVYALADAGLLVAPQDADEGGPERSDTEKLIESVAELLRDFRFEVGPITWSLLSAGQNRVHLTTEERHQIAHAAVEALSRSREAT